MRDIIEAPPSLLYQGACAPHVFSDSAYDPQPPPPAQSWTDIQFLTSQNISKLVSVPVKNQRGSGCRCLVSALPLFGWETDSKSIIWRDLCSHFLVSVCVFSHSLTSLCHVFYMQCILWWKVQALWNWQLVQWFKVWLFSSSCCSVILGGHSVNIKRDHPIILWLFLMLQIYHAGYCRCRLLLPQIDKWEVADSIDSTKSLLSCDCCPVYSVKRCEDSVLFDLDEICQYNKMCNGW